ncbi:hypothetical protein F1721_01785 [Saccharopolyspora hirsuta]|uniref:Tc1-like transposase DDE domain-containing protein n=1 Tax=Saccharopolyspora hirsuta TaxID=1837 RepID=A0A5M7CET4_SACHI|nr:hypothetical protein [Saccharopolyspora hirsuta]KAA5838204.1 hypothetical protein F1721_01785 [Saccharopolyspora hirsuta]
MPESPQVDVRSASHLEEVPQLCRKQFSGTDDLPQGSPTDECDELGGLITRDHLAPANPNRHPPGDYRIRQRKRWAGEKLYIVLDNFSPHRHAEVRT